MPKEKTKKLKTARIHIQIDAEIKEQFNELCRKIGITVSGAVRIFISQAILCQGFPFVVTEKELKSDLFKKILK